MTDRAVSYVANLGDRVMTGRGPGVVRRIRGSFARVDLTDGGSDYFYRELLKPLDA